ncbi:hypothetical protein GGS23DRAFT_422270 [Durotheca rogersii]|uniref:uncharacterized protein n=1 Tax=Durotheca rogersii TaxID=419775 RepID=UPI00221EC910|nr:uncharacterized protein GGS23DRAFT_422270 [Durotheca rogersii]KAI5865339.1 hypothetical protein GGS23DRAFT_422270 [Durotheca rogersii]
MSNIMSEISSFATSKRSACDRCRSQKLRCPPREPGATACARCLRLGAECVTSYPRPPGRSSKANNPEALSQQPLRTSRPAEPRRQVAMPGSVAIPPSTSHAIVSATTATASRHTHSPTSHARSHSNDPPFVSGPYQDLFKHTSTISADNLAFLTPDPSHHDLDDVFFSMDPSTFTHAHVDKTDPSQGITPRTEDAFDNDKSAGDGNSYLENDTRLSSLMLDLSRRLEQCMEMTSSADNMMTMDIPSATDSTSQNLLTHALGDLSEFLFIVQSYVSRKPTLASDASESGATMGSSSSSMVGAESRIGTVVLLNILSAYLQIVAIYDILLQTLSDRLLEGLDEASGDSQRTLRGLPLAGLSQRQGNLQTRILLHAILHQFDTVESVLGLPAEFRVTDKSGPYSGLFEDERATGLLQAVGLGTTALAFPTNRLETRSLPSLKDAIRKIQSFLSM